MVKKLWSREVDGQLPNWLNEEQKSRCYCDDRGWVLVHKDGNEEVIVASNTLNDPGERGHGFDSVTGNSLDPDRASAHNDTSYSLIPSKTVVGEGDSVSVQLVTTGVPDETLISYTIEGIDPEDLDNGLLSGEFQIFGDTATIEIPIKSDKTTENLETFTLKLSGDLGSVQINIDDLSKTAIYNLSSNPQSSADEGDSLQIILETENVDDGLVAYSVGGVSESDIERGSSETLTVKVEQNLQNPFNNIFNISGNQYPNLKLFEGYTYTLNQDDNSNSSHPLLLSETQHGSHNGGSEYTEGVTYYLDGIQVQDSSAYASGFSAASSREIKISVTENTSSTLYYYCLHHNNMGSSVSILEDSALLVGNLNLVNGYASLVFNIKKDQLTEETPEKLILTLSDNLGTIEVDINDTSKTPVYGLSIENGITEFNEGSEIVVNLSTTNVEDGTLIPYEISGSVNLSEDFDSPITSNTGNFVVGQVETLTFNVKDDKTWAEGDENLRVELTGLGQSVSVIIKDSSIADPVYELVADKTIVNEDESFQITLNVTNVPANTQIGYTLSGSVDLNADFDEVVSSSGSFTVGSDTQVNSSDSVTFNVKDDKTWAEGDETLILTLDGGLGSVTVNIVDSSIADPVYELIAPQSSNENSSFDITLNATNIPANTQIGYTLSGSVDLNTDFDEVVSSSGFFTVGSDTQAISSASITFNVKDDKTWAEGSENLILTLDGGLGSVQVNITDSSIAGSVYELQALSSVNEGEALTITLNATNIPANTQIGYTLSGSVDLNTDFDEVVSQTGFFTVGSDTQANSSASITFNVKDDKTWAEGDENLILTLDGGLGTISVNVVDSSIADPEYELVAPQSSNENSSFDITLNATNVPSNTQIGYTLSGSVNLTNDFNEVVSQTGFFTVGSDTQANSSDSITFNVKDDKTWAEGSENLILTLDGGLGSVTVNIVDSSIEGSEYELVAPESSNENSSFDITLNATNVPANTTIGYTLSGSVDLNTDFDEVVSQTGTFTVGSDTQANSSDSITFNVKDDKTWAEGDETLILTLDGGLGTITVNIVDSSIDTPEYELVAPQSSNENSSFDITLNATNVPSNTQIGYTLSGSVDLNADFDEVMSQTGFFTVGSDTQANSSDSLTFNVRSDSSFEEGDETLTLTLDDGLGTVTVSITDSSRAIPTFGLSSNPLNQASEGGPLTISLTYQNVSAGTEIGYNLTGSTVNLNTDFDPPVSNTGKFIIGQQEEVTFNIVADESFEEGNEVLKLTLDNGKASIQVPIIDDSTATPSYNLSTSGDVTFVNENDSVTISLGYQNLSVGDEVPYTISGDVDLNDFTPPLESYSGKFVIGDPLTEKVDFFLADDKTFDEGDEILTLTLNVDGVNESKSILVKDESKQTEVYGLSAPASTDENDSFSISLNTQFVTAETEVPYTLSGNYEPEDFNPPLTSTTGTFIVGQNETLTLSVADDKTWGEGDESLTLTLDGKGISAKVDIVDSSKDDPIYELVAIPSNVNEGEALTITLNAENVPANTTIGYSIDAVGGGISLTDDFDSPVSSTGSFTVGSDTQVNSSDSITFNIKEDKLTEISAESLILTLDGGLGSVTVPIADTSKTEIFDLESSAVNNTIGEGGDPLVITLNTQNIPDGTYGYRIEGITSDDLNLASSDQLQGNFVLVGGTDTITLDIKADALTEIPNDVIDLSLNNGKASIQITVEDTSKTPVYDLSATPEISVDEGSPLRIDLSTENVVGNTVAYKVTGIDADDLGDGSSDLEGNFTLDSNGDSYVIFNIKADKVTEDSPEDVLVLTLTGLGEQISVNINDISKDPIWDLTTSPVGSVNEGSDLVVTLQTQNVDAGTYGYDISGSGFGPEDLDDDSDPLTGDFTVSGSPSTDSITLKIKKDYTSGEGDETITISLPTVDEVDDIDVIVNDSSNIDAVEGDAITPPIQPIHGLDLKSNSTVLALSSYSTRSINIYDLDSNNNHVLYKTIVGPSINYFGDSVAISDDKEIVLGGASWSSVDGKSKAGEAYVYKLINGDYALHQTIQPPVPTVGKLFGRGLAISQDKSTITISEYEALKCHIYKLNLNTDQYEFLQTITDGTMSASLNADGSVIFCGNHKDPGASYNNGGFTRYDFNPSNNTYEEIPSSRVVVGVNHEDFGMSISGSTTNIRAGWLVDVSPDGNVALVAGLGTANTSNVWVFDWDSVQLKYNQRQTLSSANGSTGFGAFGLGIDNHPTESNLFRVLVKPIGNSDQIQTFDLMRSINTYSISGPSSIDEGQDLVLTLNTLGINGDIAYTISGITDSDLRSGSDLTSGNFNVANDTGSITLKLKEDADGLDGSLTITVDQGGEDEASKTVTIVDNTPIYDLSSNPQISVNEGVSLRIELQTQNVSETSIPYSVSGGIDAADLDDDQISAPLTGGSFSLDSNGYGFLDFHIKADKLTEPTPENLTLTLDGGLGIISVNVVDSSKEPIWELKTSPVGSVDEDSDLVVTLQTQNVDAGTYAYDISGSGFGPEDLDDGSDPLSGNFTVSGSPSSDFITLKIKKDYSSGEGDETITISLPDVDEVDDIDVIVNDSSSLDPSYGGNLDVGSNIYPSISKDGQWLAMGTSYGTGVSVYKRNNATSSWDYQQNINPSGFFGSCGISLSEDGSILVGTDSYYGAVGVYVYERGDDGVYSSQNNFSLSDPSAGNVWAVAVSSDGETIVVSKNAGLFETYNYVNSVWTLVDSFVPGYSCFQKDISADGQTLMAADRYNGAVIYKRDGDGWLEHSRVYHNHTGQTWGGSLSNNDKLLCLGIRQIGGGTPKIFFFDWDETNQEWVERVGTIDPPVPSNSTKYDFAIFLSMSEPDSNDNVTLITTNGFSYTIPASINTYSISGPSSIDEGQDLTLTLNTLGVNGDIAYTISGIADADLDIAGGSASINGVFQVANDTGSITLKLKEDADGLDGSLTITVDQGGEDEASKTVTINDITILPETSELNMIEGYGGLGSISPDGTIITSHAIYNAADADVNVRIWSRNPVDSSISSNPIYVITPPSGSSARWGSDHISMNNNGTILAISDLSENKTYIHEYDSVSDSYILAHTISNPGSSNEFGKASISADGTMMVIVGRRDKKVWTYQYSGSSWDLISSATVSISSRIESVSISNYNKTVLVFADQYDQIYTYDWVSSTSSWSQRTGSPLSITNYGESLSLTKDGDILVVGSDGGVIPTWQVYDWNGSQWDLRFTGEDDPTHSAVGAYISSSSIINGYFAVAVTYKRNTSTDFRIINVIETPQNPS